MVAACEIVMTRRGRGWRSLPNAVAMLPHFLDHAMARLKRWLAMRFLVAHPQRAEGEGCCKSDVHARPR